MRYLITLSFKGTAYHGWQKQLNAHTVQDELDLKLSLLIGENIETLGCGRTDAGVHARQFLAHFDTNQNLEIDSLIYKLNQILPEDIVIYEIRAVTDQFNARFDANLRVYEYWITQMKDPFLTELAWYQYGPLNVTLMNEAAAMLLQHNDFECFSKVHTQVNHFLCDITYAQWHHEDHKLIFTIKANRFLRNMVRAIVGTLLEVGKSKISLHQFQQILMNKNRSEAGQSVPAHGLFLTEVHYPNEVWQK